MSFHEFTEILLCVLMTIAWLAFSWHVGPEAFQCMAVFTACGFLSILYHLRRSRDEKQ